MGKGPWGIWSHWGIGRLIPACPARGWIAMGVVLGAPGMVWVKAGLVLAAPSLLSAYAAAGKYMILQKWHLYLSQRNSSSAGEVMGQRCRQGSVLSHPWTLLVPRLFLVKSLKTPAKGEQKIVNKFQNLSRCISFCLG